MRNCGDCKKVSLRENCDKLVNQRKEISAILSEMKREPPNEFCHMLPKYILS